MQSKSEQDTEACATVTRRVGVGYGTVIAAKPGSENTAVVW